MYSVDQMSKALRWLRMHRGLLQHEVARRAGITGPMLSKYEHGHTMPTVPVLFKLLEAMDCSLGHLASILDICRQGEEPDPREPQSRRLLQPASNRELVQRLLASTFSGAPLDDEEELAFTEMLTGYCRWLRFLRDTGLREPALSE